LKRFSLRKGLDVPIQGAPKAEIQANSNVKTVGILGDDYIGLKPRILVAEGDLVGAGTPVMFDKDMPEAQIVSPVSGQIKAINRGARR
jgi:Na+-transporting NADH:ubiquinone oxidoreductase subunit A